MPLHAIRDCVATRTIWANFILPRMSDSFFSMNLEEWLIKNLQVSDETIIQGVNWNILFGIIMWKIYNVGII